MENIFWLFSDFETNLRTNVHGGDFTADSLAIFDYYLIYFDKSLFQVGSIRGKTIKKLTKDRDTYKMF